MHAAHTASASACACTALSWPPAQGGARFRCAPSGPTVGSQSPCGLNAPAVRATARWPRSRCAPFRAPGASACVSMMRVTYPVSCRPRAVLDSLLSRLEYSCSMSALRESHAHVPLLVKRAQVFERARRIFDEALHDMVAGIILALRLAHHVPKRHCRTQTGPRRRPRSPCCSASWRGAKRACGC